MTISVAKIVFFSKSFQLLNYFKYMIQVVIQTNTQNGPFSTPPAPIKGNILNIKDSNSVVFGYFKVCEFDEFILEDIIID